MKVIVAGYPKTGTKSLNQALSLLGYNNIYDFLEHWWYHGDQWSKIFNHGGNKDKFLQMYQDVDVVLDAPSFFFWKEIHDAFPDSKIILSVRDEDLWYQSYLRQKKANTKNGLMRWLIFMAASCRLNPIRMVKFYYYITNLCRIELGSTTTPDENELVDRMHFRRHYAYALMNVTEKASRVFGDLFRDVLSRPDDFRNCSIALFVLTRISCDEEMQENKINRVQFKAAPKDNLLVYNISEGWEPLCAFLGTDVPDVPFPHKNKKASVADEILEENPIAVENLRITKRRIRFAAFTAISIFIACVLVY